MLKDPLGFRAASYKEERDKIRTLRQKRRRMTSEQSFEELPEDEQLDYCRTNKALMESYWQCFDMATKEDSYEEAIKHFIFAFEMGFEKADNLFSQKSVALPLKNTRRLTKNPEINLFIGLCYKFGLGLPQSDKQAFRFIKHAAQGGLISARNFLGVCYQFGIGVDKSEANAVNCYQLAAQHNDPYAQTRLGHFYEYGIGVEKNSMKAVSLYLSATDQIYAKAQNNLGRCCANLYNKEGMVRKKADVVKWYRFSAEQGNASAQNNIGYCYRIGFGVTKDGKKAFEWYRLAARQDHTGAIYNIGYCYSHGIGVDKDENEAVKWYRLAIEKGHPRALKNLKQLKCSLARYSVFFLEKQFKKAMTIALSDESIQAQCFDHDFIYMVANMKNDDEMKTFLTTVLEFVAEKNRTINTSFTTILLSLNNALCSHQVDIKAAIADFMTELLASITLTHSQGNQIKDLMYFYCHLYNKDNAKEILESMVKLWHCACVLNLEMDDTCLNQLIGARIVNKLFDNSYTLEFTRDFLSGDLRTLFYAYECPTPWTAETLNNLLSRPFLIKNKTCAGNTFANQHTLFSNNKSVNDEAADITKKNGAIYARDLS